MTFKDCIFLIKSLAGLGPILALLTIGYVWCAGLVSLLFIAAPSKSGIFGLLNFIIYFTWLPLTVASYFRAILQGPGFVRLGWSPQVASDEQFLQFCSICDGFKPPRAHHCRKCNRCCMKMDHHCIWLGKCVGYRNQASFLLFLFGAVSGAFHGTAMIFRFSYLQLWVRLTVMPNIVLVVMVGSGFGLGTVIAVGVLLYSHLKITLKNETNIESWIIEKANWRRKEILNSDEIYEYPYDLGWRQNLFECFYSTSDGMDYPLKAGCPYYSFTIEQKLQKALKKEKAILFNVIKDYSGYKCPIFTYPKSMLRSPIFDPTLPLSQNDQFVVTRGRKGWFYGYKPDLPNIRGFVPKECLKEEQKNSRDDSNQKKNK